MNRRRSLGGSPFLAADASFQPQASDPYAFRDLSPYSSSGSSASSYDVSTPICSPQPGRAFPSPDPLKPRFDPFLHGKDSSPPPFQPFAGRASTTMSGSGGSGQKKASGQGYFSQPYSSGYSATPPASAYMYGSAFGSSLPASPAPSGSSSNLSSGSGTASKSKKKVPKSEAPPSNPNQYLLQQNSYSLVDLPPVPYSGPSPFAPAPTDTKIFASQMDLLPPIDQRISNLERGVSDVFEARGRRAVRDATLPGLDPWPPSSPSANYPLFPASRDVMSYSAAPTPAAYTFPSMAPSSSNTKPNQNQGLKRSPSRGGFTF